MLAFCPLHSPLQIPARGIFADSFLGQMLMGKWDKWRWAAPAWFLYLPLQLSGPGTPEGGVHTWGRGGGGVCVLVIFSHLTLFSPTDPGWGFRERGVGLHIWIPGKVETKGAQNGVTVLF